MLYIKKKVVLLHPRFRIVALNTNYLIINQFNYESVRNRFHFNSRFV